MALWEVREGRALTNIDSPWGIAVVGGEFVVYGGISRSNAEILVKEHNKAVLESIDLRQFLNALYVEDLRGILLWARINHLQVKRYSRMCKDQLIDEIISKLDEPVVFKDVVERLYVKVNDNEYPKKPRASITGSSDDDPVGDRLT